MKELKRDMLCGGFFAVFGILLRIFRDKMITGKIVTELYGPLTFPTLIAYCLVICGVLLIFNSYGKYKKVKNEAIEKGTYNPNDDKLTGISELIKREWKVLAFMALSLLYVYLLRKVGYLIVSYAAATIILLMMNAKKKSYYISVYASIMVIYVGFLYGLKVQLPLGSWFGF